MINAKYIFPAILEFNSDGISIEFPDLPGCLPCAHTQDEAIRNAREAMRLHLKSMISDGDEIPTATKEEDIKLKDNQKLIFVEC